MSQTHQTAKTQYADSGEVRYAYRRFGNTSKTTVPVIFLIHFRGNMDFWDPLLVNSIAAERPVILFDNAGVGKSTGTVPSTAREMAKHVIKFLELIQVKEVDVLGFSMGGFIAPLVHLDGPAGLVRKLVIAGSGPSAGEGVVNHSEEQNNEVGRLAGQPTPASTTVWTSSSSPQLRPAKRPARPSGAACRNATPRPAAKNAATSSRGATRTAAPPS